MANGWKLACLYLYLGGGQVSDKEEVIKASSDIQLSNVMGDVKDMWNISDEQMRGMSRASRVVSTKHGMFSGVPIVCKAEGCPYKETCLIDEADRIKGSRCPQEISSLLSRFEKICTELKITEEDAIDMGQVKELVDIEIMMLRCDNKIASNSDVLMESIKDVTKSGVTIYEWQADPAIELKLNLMDKHSKILKDLNATRSSKKEVGKVIDPSLEASQLIQRAKELELSFSDIDDELIIEADYEDETIE